MSADARIGELERRLGALERELAQRLAGAEPRPHPVTRVIWVVRVVGFVVLAVTLVGAVANVDAVVVADTIPFWAHVVVAVGFLSLFLAILMWRAEAKWRGLTFIVLFVPIFLAGGLGADMPSTLNRLLDASPTEVTTGRVRSLSTTSRSHGEVIVLEPWGQHGCTMRVEPRRASTKPWRIGQLVKVLRHRGRFGWEWIGAIESADEEPREP